MTYRNRKLLDAAKDAPRCFACGKSNDGDVVMAHADSQRYGKGTGHKSHDWAIAAMCFSCHNLVGDGKELNREEKMHIWHSAHINTLEWLFDAGVLGVMKGG